MNDYNDALPVSADYKRVQIIAGLDFNEAGEEVEEWYFNKIGDTFEVYETTSGNWGLVKDIGIAVIPRMIKKAHAIIISD